MILQDNIAYLKELEEDLARRKQFVLNAQLDPANDNIVRYLEYRVDFVRGLVEAKPEDGGKCASSTPTSGSTEVR